MKKTVVLILLSIIVKTSIAQGSYFTCNETGIYLTGGSVTITLPNQTKEKVKQHILSFIKERKYVYKPFYSGENMISFRDFATICGKTNCGADLIAKVLFHLTYDSGFVKITLDNEIYSSFYGGELVINGNDDVASKNDVPFAPYEFQVPEQYASEYPESVYSFNKKGKTTLKNPEVQKILLAFFNWYITDIKSYLENK